MQQARLPLSGGFVMENNSDVYMAALICCNSVSYDWYRYTGTGESGLSWSECIFNEMWLIIHPFHATSKASLNRGLRDGKWQWCGYGSTYSLQPCSIWLVWTHRVRKNRSHMTFMHTQWGVTHNAHVSCNKAG